MLFSLSMALAMLASVGSAQTAEKMCSFTIDPLLFAYTNNPVYVVTDQCNFIEVEGDDEDLEVSWEYTCDNGGNMMVSQYGGLNCDGPTNTTQLFASGGPGDGSSWDCVDEDMADNCDVKLEWRSPCTGSSEMTGQTWPAKEVCIGENGTTWSYQCFKGDDGHDLRYTVTDSPDCGDDFSWSVLFTLYESGCDEDDDILIEIDCNAAASLYVAIPSIFALLAAFFH